MTPLLMPVPPVHALHALLPLAAVVLQLLWHALLPPTQFVLSNLVKLSY
jgi:hypothetical protein